MALTPPDQLATLLRVMVGRVGKRVIAGAFVMLVSASAAPVIGHDGFQQIINDFAEAADVVGIAGGVAISLTGAYKAVEEENRRRDSSQEKSGANSNEQEDDEGDQSGSLKS